MVLEQLSRMWGDKSYLVGAIASGLSFAIPEWIFLNHEWTMYHTVAMCIFLGSLILDQITGRRLAKVSDKVRKSSTAMIDSVFKNFSMVVVVVMAYGIDWVLNTGSICFVFMLTSLTFHTFYSFLANAVVLGWGKNYPIWLFEWLSDEIKTKANKYFKDSNIETELDEKLNNK